MLDSVWYDVKTKMSNMLLQRPLLVGGGACRCAFSPVVTVTGFLRQLGGGAAAVDFRHGSGFQTAALQLTVSPTSCFSVSKTGRAACWTSGRPHGLSSCL